MIYSIRRILRNGKPLGIYTSYKLKYKKMYLNLCHLSKQIWNRKEIVYQLTDRTTRRNYKWTLKTKKKTLTNGEEKLDWTWKVLCRIIINIMQDAIDNFLMKEQAGFRTCWDCLNKMFITRNIVEQCIE